MKTMKTMSSKTKQLYIRAKQWLLGNILYFLLNLWGWIKNVFFTFIWFKSKPRVFSGWMHYKFSVWYADKRTRCSTVNKYCGGKIHYVLPYAELSLIVVSRGEIVFFRNKGYFNKNLDILKILKMAYYVSDNKPKKFNTKTLPK